jgi:CD109 antigen
VEGSLQANYFFGKPVSEGQVLIEGFSFDVERVSAFTLEGQTDAEGNFDFAFELPAYLAGSEFEGGMARFYLEATVIDQAQHSEVKNLSLPVASSVLMVAAVPEGGVFRPGLENILYVIASYPDGTPAEADLRIEFYNNGQQLNQQTGVLRAG